jgi:hypothetical protein
MEENKNRKIRFFTEKKCSLALPEDETTIGNSNVQQARKKKMSDFQSIDGLISIVESKSKFQVLRKRIEENILLISTVYFRNSKNANFIL